MRSTLSVTTAAATNNLTTRARAVSELKIAATEDMTVLDRKIAEASSDIEAALGFRVPLETVQETFWLEVRDDYPEFIVLNRTPVTAIASVTLDDVVQDASRYRLDDETGQLYALDANGYACRWIFQKSIVVAYSGGYVLPGQAAATLPAAIESAVFDLISDFWLSRGKDPSVKSINIPGVRQVDYWVGSIGDPSELPPQVLRKLARFRRVLV